MRASLRSITFKDFVTLQRGFDLPRKKRNPGKYPVVASTTIADYHCEYKVEPPGVVTGRSGSLGEVQYITEPFWPLNTALWVKDFKGSLPRYVYYFLQTLELERFNSGAGVPTLNRNDLDTLEISIHGLEDQRKIAAILSAYDDLIENNTRRITILEEMAQAIYREWFVHFRFPGHEQVAMVDSELGPIPEGWEWIGYSELLESYLGGGWGLEEPSEKETRPVVVIRGTDFDDVRLGNELRAPIRYITESSLEKRRLQEGDVVVENSVNASSRCVGSNLLITRGTLNRIGMDTIAASFCKVFRPHDPKLGVLIHLHLKYLYGEGRMEFYQHVATNGIGNFQASRFVNSEAMPLPKDEALLAEMIGLLKDLTTSNYAERNANLRRTRDLLLPRLISGEIDVSELEINTGGLDQ